MQNNHSPKTTPISMIVVLKRAAAVVFALISAAILVALTIFAKTIADTYGNITEGGFEGIAAVVGVLAAGFGALSAALWSQPDSGKLVLKVFLSILVVTAIIFGVVYLLSDKVIIG